MMHWKSSLSNLSILLLGNKIAYFFKVSMTFEEMLPAMYEVMYTNNLKPDNRNVLLKNVYILTIIGDFMTPATLIFFVMQEKGPYLFQLLTILPICFANEINWFILKHQGLTMDFDINENLLGKTKSGGTTHTVLLN